MRADVAPARDDPDYPYFPPWSYDAERHDLGEPGQLSELHLYHGSACNRACAFCCVGGHPKGWHRDFAPEVLDAVPGVLAAQGRLKLFGGEPTLHVEAMIEAVGHLRSRGFEGPVQVYSNGILAGRLIALLEAVEGATAVLNYSILHGRGAAPLPARALRRLLAWGEPRIFSGHAEVIEAAAAPDAEATRDPALPDFGGRCPHCYPVLRSDGQFHGCPFAVEQAAPHFALGVSGVTSGAEVVERFRAHVAWQRDVVEVEARARGISPCAVCAYHVDALPLPEGW